MALYALGEISGEEYASAMALGLVPGGKLLGKLGSFLGKVGGAAWSAATRMAPKAGGFLRASFGLAARAATWVARKVGKALGKGKCGCFTAATLVWTPAGAVPIGELDQGAEVWAASDTGQASAAVPATVGSKIIIGEASLLRLTVRHADGSVETINTTDEHPFHVTATSAWTRADRLRPGDRLSSLIGHAEVVAISFGGERVPVYNLSIPGSPTYYVGERGVWVHNDRWCFVGRRPKAPKNLYDPSGLNGSYPAVAYRGNVYIGNHHAQATQFARQEHGVDSAEFLKGSMASGHVELQDGKIIKNLWDYVPSGQ